MSAPTSAPAPKAYRLVRHGERVLPGDHAIMTDLLIKGRYSLQAPIESSAWIESCLGESGLEFVVGKDIPSTLTHRRLVAPTFLQRVVSALHRFFSRTP